MFNEFSNYSIASKNAISYLGHDAVLYPSTRKNMKFMIQNPYTGKFIHFGRLGYFDYKIRERIYRNLDFVNAILRLIFDLPFLCENKKSNGGRKSRKSHNKGKSRKSSKKGKSRKSRKSKRRRL